MNRNDPDIYDDAVADYKNKYAGGINSPVGSIGSIVSSLLGLLMSFAIPLGPILLQNYIPIYVGLLISAFLVVVLYLRYRARYQKFRTECLHRMLDEGFNPNTRRYDLEEGFDRQAVLDATNSF